VHRTANRRLRLTLLAAAVLAAAVAGFLAWGPIGLGSGPLSAGGGGDYGIDPNLAPLAVLDPVSAGHSGAVIDSVSLTGGDYPAPHVTAIRAAPADIQCAGFLPIHGGNESLFGAYCLHPGDLHALLGRPIPAPVGGWPGVTMVLEVAPPPASGCWEITALVIHYHVGIRHYTRTAPKEVGVCRSPALAQLLNP
jgi:hypothetical protein